MSPQMKRGLRHLGSELVKLFNQVALVTAVGFLFAVGATGGFFAYLQWLQ